MDKQALNKKLAKWVGFIYDKTQTKGFVHDIGWKDPEGHRLYGQHWSYLPDLTESLDACFKWLMPPECSVSFNHGKDGLTCLLTVSKGKGIYGSNTFIGQAGVNEDALAFCLAREKMIDSEVNNGNIETVY